MFINTSRTRKSTRKAIHNSTLIETFTSSKKIFYATFSASLFIVASKNIKLHKNNLSSKSKYYKNMIKHSLASRFVQIIFTKIEILQLKDTWKQMSHHHAQKTKKTLILITWIFKYKLDIENFLIKYKAHLCAKDNLQSIKQNVYAATLTYKIFRTFMTIINVWNLKTRQYDAVNAFANSDIDEPTYCFSSKNWKKSKVLLLLLKVLYELKQTSILWYRHLIKTLIDLRLK